MDNASSAGGAAPQTRGSPAPSQRVAQKVCYELLVSLAREGNDAALRTLWAGVSADLAAADAQPVMAKRRDLDAMITFLVALHAWKPDEPCSFPEYVDARLRLRRAAGAVAT